MSNFTLRENASLPETREFISYWRGCVSAVEPLRPYLDNEKLIDAYTTDMTIVLDALELATRGDV